MLCNMPPQQTDEKEMHFALETYVKHTFRNKSQTCFCYMFFFQVSQTTNASNYWFLTIKIIFVKRILLIPLRIFMSGSKEE